MRCGLLQVWIPLQEENEDSHEYSVCKTCKRDCDSCVEGIHLEVAQKGGTSRARVPKGLDVQKTFFTQAELGRIPPALCEDLLAGAEAIR